ncbi:craniofacial development protein 2-like [Montipora capricornis]|uniref:craniofacial development protein 2-like n=1 Tax=Montipora foliosa TaxID=591990 RepID=UPI0035F2161E
MNEIRWTGFRELRTATGQSILYSGREEEHHREVGLILKKEVRKTLLKRNLVNERIMGAHFNSRYAKLTVIQMYAPTNDANDESKEEFYDQLQQEVETTPRNDVLIVMGGLNAKIGEDNKGWEKVMGQHGLGRMNENGERLATFCGNNDLVAGGNLFKHRDIYKITWTSPNAKDRNQSDHIIINGKYRGLLMDTREMRGADANSHGLKLRSTKRKRREKTIFDIKKLRDPCVKEVFRLEVSN